MYFHPFFCLEVNFRPGLTGEEEGSFQLRWAWGHFPQQQPDPTQEGGWMLALEQAAGPQPWNTHGMGPRAPMSHLLARTGESLDTNPAGCCTGKEG